jgi:AAA domain (dynein-related subfamily)/Midasin AAA lid domain
LLLQTITQTSLDTNSILAKLLHAVLNPSENERGGPLAADLAAVLRDYLFTLRQLFGAGCLAGADVDIGGLLRLLGELDPGKCSATMVSNGGDEDDMPVERSNRPPATSIGNTIMFQAVSLTCELLHLPHEYKITSLTRLIAGLSPQELAELLSTDLQNGFTSCTGSDLEPLGAFREDVIAYAPLGTKNIVYIGGYLLPSTRKDEWCPRLIQTPTSIQNLSKFAQAISTSLPVIVQGEVGCGKSFIIRELASAMGQESTLIELHLDDQTDSKSLIGAYVCSDVPGEFLWQHGVITQAVIRGHWLVIEDIDKVPIEIIAAISSLLERRMLYLPSRGLDIQAHPSFRIIGTRSLASSESAASLSSSSICIPNMRHFSHLWQFVSLSIPHQEEIESIIQTKYPLLLSIVIQQLLDTYNMFNISDNATSQLEGMHAAGAVMSLPLLLRKTRKFTLRDLIKAAGRIAMHASDFNQVSGMITDDQKCLCLKEVVDIFATSIRDRTMFESVVYQLGRNWDIQESEILSLIIESQPQYTSVALHQSVSISIGRICLDRISITGTASSSSSSSSSGGGSGRGMGMDISTGQDSDDSPQAQQFAFTNYALRMLERIAACVVMDEPVLLVGETGKLMLSAVVAGRRSLLIPTFTAILFAQARARRHLVRNLPT